MKPSPYKTALLAASIASALQLSPSCQAADDNTLQPPACSGKWCFSLPRDGQVAYRGLANFDNAGTGRGAMLYPAPSPAGFLVALVTHGLFVESSRNSQKKKLQEDADKVLTPYKTVLDEFSYGDLMKRAAERTSSAGVNTPEESSDSAGKMVFDSTPVFSMTQDQKAIILDNAIVAYKPGNSAAIAYRNTVRVVSAASHAPDPVAFWTGSAGENLKNESAKLLAASLEIAFKDEATGAKKDGSPFQTIHYREGTAEEIERAQVIGNSCDRLVLRTLRGTLLSVPTQQGPSIPSATESGCGPDSSNKSASSH